MMRMAVLIIVLVSIFFNIGTLNDGHNWGDDFAQYIINARNVIEHKPYASGIMLDNDVVYPPGLPLLLAPVLTIFGLKFKLLKVINILSWYLSLFFLYFILLRNESKRIAQMAVVFLALSSYFFVYKQNVLSDLPFFLFVSLSFYAFERWRNISSKDHDHLFFAALLLSMTAALWVRSAGVVLFAAALFYFIFIKRDNRAWASVLIVFIINELLLLSWMGWHAGFCGRIPDEFLRDISHQFPTVFRSLWFFFCPLQTVFGRPLYNIVDPFVSVSAPIFYLILIWSFVRGLRLKNLSFIECFSFFYISLLIFWSGFNDSPGGFTRFVLPLLPFVFISIGRLSEFLKQFKFDFSPWVRVVFLVLLLINISNIIINRDFNDDVFNVPENIALFDWIKQNMKPEEHFMFWKPRALALFTQREGTPPWIYADQQRYFIQRVKEFKVSYVFTVKHDDIQGLTVFLDGNKHFKLVGENNYYKVFRFIN